MAEVMSEIDAWLDEYVDHLRRQLSHRYVTRSFQGRESLSDRILEDGCITVLFEGSRPDDFEDHDILMVMVVGQIQLPESSQPLDIERAELAMFAEFRRFVKSPEGTEWHIKGLATSHQLEAPFGWFTARCEIGPIYLGFEEPASAEPEVMIGQSPDIGPGHETDYKSILEFTDD